MLDAEHSMRTRTVADRSVKLPLCGLGTCKDVDKNTRMLAVVHQRHAISAMLLELRLDLSACCILSTAQKKSTSVAFDLVSVPS